MASACCARGSVRGCHACVRVPCVGRLRCVQLPVRLCGVPCVGRLRCVRAAALYGAGAVDTVHSGRLALNRDWKERLAFVDYYYAAFDHYLRV